MADEASNGSDPPDSRTAFERFEDLTKRLVAVPKAEVYALRKKQEQSRRRGAARHRTS